MVITDISNDLLQRIKVSWESDPNIQQIISKVQDRSSVGSKFTWQDDQLRRNGKLVIGSNENLRQELLKYYHDEPLGGHSGVEASYKRLKVVFYWKGMKRSVREHTDISMDFIEGLPTSHGKTVILVIVDRLSKYGRFIPLTRPFKAAQIA
ncbi:transposon ty3-I gag-pol polyprotein [Tanacetum coccineum]